MVRRIDVYKRQIYPRAYAPRPRRGICSVCPLRAFPILKTKFFGMGIPAINNACRENRFTVSRQAFEQCCASGDSNKAAIMKRPR